MYYDKTYKVPKPIRKRLKLSNFKGYDEDAVTSTLPCDYTADCANFGFKRGKLTVGNGIGKFEGFPPPVDSDGVSVASWNSNLFVAGNDAESDGFKTLVVSCADGIYCAKASASPTWLRYECDALMTSATRYLYGDKELLLMSDGVDGLRIYSEEAGVVKVENSPAIKDMCTHYERVYAVVGGKRNSLWFSDDFNPYNWNVSLEEGGYIAFDGTLGNVNRVLSFIDYLYVFCDYGIYRLTAFIDQTQFSMKRLYCSCGRIFADSVTECGEYIAFAASDGVYVFDGYDVRKLSARLVNLLGEQPRRVSGAYCDGKYYLAFSREEKEEEFASLNKSEGNNTLAVVDLSTRNVDVMRGVDIRCLQAFLSPTRSAVIGLSGDCDSIVSVRGDGTYMGYIPVRLWRIRDVDMGYPYTEKLLRGVEYTAKTQYVLGIIADGERRELIMSPLESYHSINVKGKSFDFYIRGDCDAADITPPVFTVDFLRP